MRSQHRARSIVIWVSVLVIAIIVGIAYSVSSCSSSFASVPPGYVGKVLTPKGYDPRVLEPGQVDLGKLGNGGVGKSLVLLESVSTTVREKFQEAAANDDKVDDRVLTKDGVPLTLTIYIRLTAPSDEQSRNVVFEQMTPAISKDRVSTILLQDVYDRFAKMDVRNRIRAIAASYENYKSLYADFYAANERINSAVEAVLKENNVPLTFLNAGISNAKPDQKVWDAENEKVAAQARADAMNIISAAISADPNNLTTLKWQYLQKITEIASTNGTKIIVITDTDSPMAETVPAALSQSSGE